MYNGKMSKTEETRRYKWSNSATNLLVSIWSHDMVQGRLKLATRNQPIWESIARFMGRKGFNVTGLQCRTRIKNMLCNYYESVRKKDRGYIEPYFDIFQKIVNSRNQKKKGSNKEKSKEITNFEVSDCDLDNAASSESSVDAEQSTSTKINDVTTGVKNFGVHNQEGQMRETPSTYIDNMANVENLITKAVDNQTKVISEIIKVQTEIVEKLLVSERERLEAIIFAERESRKQFEEKMDKIITKLEFSAATKQCTKSLIES